MSPSKIESNFKFSYIRYSTECAEAGKVPVVPNERSKANIARLMKILVPTSAWVRVTFDDSGIEAMLTKPLEHAPYALTVRSEYSTGLLSVYAFSDEGHTLGDTISSHDLLDIVEFCVIALRQYRFSFTASHGKKSCKVES